MQEKFYAKFRKDLSALQVAKVLRLNEGCGFGPKPCCGKEGKGQCEGKGHGKFEGKHKHPGPRPEGPRPEAPKEAK